MPPYSTIIDMNVVNDAIVIIKDIITNTMETIMRKIPLTTKNGTIIIKKWGKYTCGPCISAHALPLDRKLAFYLKNDLFIKKMTWSRHLFLFYF